MGYNFGVGRQAPTFAISAVDGNEVALKQYRGDWCPVLVFIPTGSPDAAQTLKQLGGACDTLWGMRGQLVGICDGGRDAAADLAAAAGAVFPLLPDDGATARQYGALKEDGTLRPMAFIIDRAGKIVWGGEGQAALKAAKLLAAFRQVVR